MRRAACGWTVVSLAVALALTGCDDLGDPAAAPTGPPPPAPVSFASEIQPIFDANCVHCHGAVANAGLDLRSGTSYGLLVDVTAAEIDMPRVDPGELATSWLYLKITGAQTVGDPMPQDAFPLPQATVDVIARWITEGALDN